MSMKINDKAFRRVLKDSFNITNRSAKSLVMSASIFFIQSARKATKTARKGTKRELIPTDQKGVWDILVRHQNKPDRYIFTTNKNDKLRNIKTIGAAKNSWNGALKSLGKNISNQAKSGFKLGEAIDATKRLDPYVMIINNTSYLGKINPGIESFAMGKAARRMEHNLDRVVKKKLQGAWK